MPGLHGQSGPGAQHTVLEVESAQGIQPASGGGAAHVGHEVQRVGSLQVHGATAESREGPQGGEPGRNRPRGVRVHGSRTGVPRVQGGQQLADLRATAFPHHEPIRAHPQRLPDQVREVHGTGPLHVLLPGLHADHVGMIGVQLRGVLHEHEALSRRALGQ